MNRKSNLLLLKKDRQELIQLGSERVSYSNTDILVEDFVEFKDHPYAIYDFSGNILETNFKDGKLLFELYRKSLPHVLSLLETGYA